MASVYVLTFDQEYEGGWVCGVYSEKDKALEDVQKIMKEAYPRRRKPAEVLGNDDECWVRYTQGSCYTVTKYEVDGGR